MFSRLVKTLGRLNFFFENLLSQLNEKIADIKVVFQNYI